jgi:hypothetical protein
MLYFRILRYVSKKKKLKKKTLRALICTVGDLRVGVGNLRATQAPDYDPCSKIHPAHDDGVVKSSRSYKVQLLIYLATTINTALPCRLQVSASPLQHHIKDI